jgi:hypothetical protein
MDKLIDFFIRSFLKIDVKSYIEKNKKEQEVVEQKIKELIDGPRKTSARSLEEENKIIQTLAASLSQQLGPNATPSILELKRQHVECLREVDRATETKVQYVLDFDYKNRSAILSLETATLDVVKWIGTLSTAVLAFSVGFIGRENLIDIERQGLIGLLLFSLGLLGISIILCLDYARRAITRNLKALHRVVKQQLNLETEKYEIAVVEVIRQRFIAYATYYIFAVAMLNLVSVIFLRSYFVTGLYFYSFSAILIICLFFYLKRDFLSY